MRIQFSFVGFVFLIYSLVRSFAAEGPIRVLFLGHESEHHNSNLYYPMLEQALGPDAIYFDYVTSVEEALGNGEFLRRFDAFLVYANHAVLESHQWQNLMSYVEEGGGFLPIHCASWCFANEPGFDQLVGGRFKSHQSGVFKVRTTNAAHSAIAGVPELEAWDETYFHSNHNPENRTVLQVRDAAPGDPHTEPEPWTWVRTQGKGRVFYTASGHDHRVWSRAEFHQLLKKGILWSVGDERRARYEAFLKSRRPLQYERRADIPNYERRPEPLRYQLPLLPEDSMDYTRVPMGFRLELVASEPDIVNPIALSWDERGRLWVAETIDYPNEIKEGRQGRDRIKILEDTDADGRCDKVTIFADGLNIPTALVPCNGGFIVAHAPDMLFLKDIDGDDRADIRQVLNTGWGVQDTHAGPSNLRYGFDNRIWGTVGYSGYAGEVSGEPNRFGSGVFRMGQRGEDVTFLHQFNNNTWGFGFNAAGDVFGSTANNNPSFFCGFPATGYGDSRGVTALMIADSRAFHPLTPNVRQVDAFGNYTAGAGHALATSSAFPESWRDSMAFVCGPTGHLLGGFRMLPDGSGFRAKSAFSLVASADEWFSPVAAEVGPDGALWIADWYNFIIQHNPTPSVDRGGYAAKRGIGNAHINPNRDRQHGRIYRLVWESASAPRTTSLEGARARALVRALSDDNLFWRLTAQRLLVEADAADALQLLRKEVVEGGQSSVHALWALHGMGRLDRLVHQAALLSSNPALKQNAIRALSNDTEGERLLFDTAVVADANLAVRRDALIKMAHLAPSETVRRAVNRLFMDPENREDPWISLALKTMSQRYGIALGGREFGPNLLVNPSFEEGPADAPKGWQTHTYGGRGEASFSVTMVAPFRRSGSRALKIESDRGADAGWRTEVAVKPNTEYRLSGWIMTRGVNGAMGALLNVHSMQGVLTKALQKRNHWTEVEAIFNSGNRSSIVINCLFGGWGTSIGEAYYDDLSLQEITYEPMDADEAAAGDVGRGKQIFRKHPVASCARCHRLEGEGGTVGPVLDGIARRKHSDYIRQSLLEPQATIAEGYPAEVSPMPPFGVLLKPQEIEDLMAFLLTLKTPAKPGTVEAPKRISFE
ncbi:MAG: hypothetical protein M2R45_03364 [Verrucomicrobia subdivision 3 bacterium]|nr:hypothetical protein [Limisphaerales bacterium]MCS1416723.1 hypothetical protein [Limisphaerales bacterium]